MVMLVSFSPLSFSLAFSQLPASVYRAQVIKVPETEWLNSRDSLSHGSGGKKSRIKASAGPAPSVGFGAGLFQPSVLASGPLACGRRTLVFIRHLLCMHVSLRVHVSPS